MTILTRSEYAHAVGVVDRLSKAHRPGEVFDTMQSMLQCIASYRVICYHLAQLLYDAIAECDDAQQLAQLRDTLKQPQRGES